MATKKLKSTSVVSSVTDPGGSMSSDSVSLDSHQFTPKYPDLVPGRSGQIPVFFSSLAPTWLASLSATVPANAIWQTTAYVVLLADAGGTLRAMFGFGGSSAPFVLPVRVGPRPGVIPLRNGNPI